MQSRRTLLMAVLVGSLSLFAAGGARAATEQDAKAFIDKLATQAIEFASAKGQTDQERTQRFRQIFTANFDIPEIAKFVLGRYGRGTTPEQMQDFLKLFEDLQVLMWSSRFKEYGGTFQHQVTGVSPDGERGFFVDSVVKREKQEPINLQWRLRSQDGALKVIDLSVESSWMAITYRSEYASVIQNNGGKVDGLLAVMRKKVAEYQANPAAAAAAAAAPGGNK